MSLFNKKEDVMQIELTQYGKHLLSKGKFKPEYYAFFDDDILYDGQYADLEEEQNDVQNRIEETPRRKTQYVFSSREKAVKRLTSLLRSGKARLGDNLVQSTPDKHYALSSALGNSLIGSQQAPAWKINFLKGSMSKVVPHIAGGAQQTTKIPQIALNPVTYKTQVLLDTPPDEDLVNKPAGPRSGDQSAAGTQSDLTIATEQFSDGTYLAVYDDFVLLAVEEENTDIQKENFDIEVFLVEEVDAQGNVVESYNSDNIKTREKLYPLSFVKKPEYIKNGILLDEDSLPEEEMFPEIDPSFVEYWFDIICDYDISEEVLCENQPPETHKGNIYNEEGIVCPDDGGSRNPMQYDKTEDAVRDPYKGSSSSTFGRDKQGTSAAYEISSGDEGDEC